GSVVTGGLPSHRSARRSATRGRPCRQGRAWSRRGPWLRRSRCRSCRDRLSVAQLHRQVLTRVSSVVPGRVGQGSELALPVVDGAGRVVAGDDVGPVRGVRVSDGGAGPAAGGQVGNRGGIRVDQRGGTLHSDPFWGRVGRSRLLPG